MTEPSVPPATIIGPVAGLPVEPTAIADPGALRAPVGTPARRGKHAAPETPGSPVGWDAPASASQQPGQPDWTAPGPAGQPPRDGTGSPQAGPGPWGPGEVPPGGPPPTTPPAWGAPGQPVPPAGPPGWGAPGYPVPPGASAGTNGFAIAAFALGILGIILLSVVFAIVALVQISRRPQGGKRLAIAGLVISGVWVALIVVVIVYAIATSAQRDDSGRITSSGSVSVGSLLVGDCVNGIEEGNLLSVPAVPCAEPHEGEVFALFELSGDWPGEGPVADRSEQGCVDRFDAYAPAADNVDSLELFSIQPTEESWRGGDREVICIATDPTAKRTGSLRD